MGDDATRARSTDGRKRSGDDQIPIEVGEIASFYVLPGAWGRGIGRAPMTASVGALRTAGFRSASLWVLATNAAAIRHLRYVRGLAGDQRET